MGWFSLLVEFFWGASAFNRATPGCTPPILYYFFIDQKKNYQRRWVIIGYQCVFKGKHFKKSVEQGQDKSVPISWSYIWKKQEEKVRNWNRPGKNLKKSKEIERIRGKIEKCPKSVQNVSKKHPKSIQRLSITITKKYPKSIPEVS